MVYVVGKTNTNISLLMQCLIFRKYLFTPVFGKCFVLRVYMLYTVNIYEDTLKLRVLDPQVSLGKIIPWQESRRTSNDTYMKHIEYLLYRF